MRLFVVCALLASTTTSAYVLKRDSSNEVIRWQKQSVSFIAEAKIAEHLGEPRTVAALEAALHSYQAALPNMSFLLREGSENGIGEDLAREGPSQNMILAPVEWIFDDNAIAVTVVTSDNGSHEILSADIALNPRHSFRALMMPGLPYDDIQNAVTHELGHAVGLAHNPADSSVVMYPSARLGETNKRMLAPDDLAGLAALYPNGGVSHTGCSATHGMLTLWLALWLLPALALRLRSLSPHLIRGVLWLERVLPASAGQSRPLSRVTRRGVQRVPPLPSGDTLPRREEKFRAGWLVALLFLPVVSRGEPPVDSDCVRHERADAPVGEAIAAGTGDVLASRTLPPAKGSRILITQVEVSLFTCLKGSCPERIVLSVPGGTWGNIEQHIEDAPVPKVGDALGVTIAPGDSLEWPALAQARVYRLEMECDFSAFAQGVSRAGISAQLRSGSSSPSQ